MRTPADGPGTVTTEVFTTRSGARIRYLDNDPAEPAGLPILFSPGFSDHADDYVEMLDFFLPRRVLVVEVRGRGGSEAPASGYSAADHAADLRAVLDEEGIDRFHLVTFSRGTTWGLDVALADPARVATISVGDYWAAEKALDPPVADYLLGSRFRGRPNPERIAERAARGLVDESHERDLYDALASSGVPVLLATGTEDGRLLDDSAIDEWRRRVPGIEVVVIEGAAHDLFRRDRLAYPRAIAEFITRRAPAT